MSLYQQEEKGAPLINRRGKTREVLFFVAYEDHGSFKGHKKAALICDPDETLPLTRGAHISGVKAEFFLSKMHEIMADNGADRPDEVTQGIGYDLIAKIKQGILDAELKAFEERKLQERVRLMKIQKARTERARQKYIETHGHSPVHDRLSPEMPVVETTMDEYPQWFRQLRTPPEYCRLNSKELAFENKNGEALHGIDALILANQYNSLKPFEGRNYSAQQIDNHLEELFEQLHNNELTSFQKEQLLQPPAHVANPEQFYDCDVPVPQLKTPQAA